MHVFERHDQRWPTVTNRRSASNLTPRYNDFLFASICEEASGIHLSVLSALARTNVDPWEEATRLAAMPRATAVRTLASTLDLMPSGNWNPSETETIAARLVRLLPQRSEGTSRQAAGSGAQRSNYWLVWLGFAIAMSLLSPRHQAATPDAGVSASKSSTSSTIKKSVGANTTLPDTGHRLRQNRLGDSIEQESHDQ